MVSAAVPAALVVPLLLLNVLVQPRVWRVEALSSSTYPYVYGISPAGITNMDSTATLRILGGRQGDVCYLVHSSYNCSNPPLFNTGRRTWLSTVSSGGLIHTPFAVHHLNPGTYRVCYLGAHRINATQNASTTYPAFRNNPDAARSSGGFVALPYAVAVGGSVDRGLSSFSCSGDFTAGNVSTCTILLRDGDGNPTGSTNTTCQITLCPFLDGRGSAMQDYTPPTMTSFGTYVVTFMPRESGCQGTLAVLFGGLPLAANTQAYFHISAGSPASNRSTSVCTTESNTGSVACTITQRDEFDNPIKLCSYNSTGGTQTCTTIS